MEETASYGPDINLEIIWLLLDLLRTKVEWCSNLRSLELGSATDDFTDT